MAFTKDMRAAGQRHYADGVKLFDERRFDNAGYHFGFAAECAVKQRLLDCGVAPEDEAVWKHWPSLRALALLAISSRSASDLRNLLAPQNYMSEWDVTMRYAGNSAVNEQLAQRWKDHANRALGLLL
jgi:hypothetical protein